MNMRKKKLKRVLAGIELLLIALAFAALVVWATSEEEGNGTMMFENLSQEQQDDRRVIDWGSLPDSVIAWIEVPGTNIDEPIVQASKDSPNAYLYLDALEQGNYGTPYIDCDCTLQSPFVMVYGHHMSDGSVFADFASYSNETYACEHQKVLLYTREYGDMELEVFAVDVLNASNTKLKIEGMTADTITTSADLIINKPEGPTQVFAFATCSYQTWNSRTVVYAR